MMSSKIGTSRTPFFKSIGCSCRRAAVSVAVAALFAPAAHAQVGSISPITTCDNAGIGSATLVSDIPTLPTTVPPNDTSVTITSVSTGTSGGIPYCLVKVLVKPAINIWFGMPTGGNWNGRLQSIGGGGYAGSVGAPTAATSTGYMGVETDTGHTGGSGTFGCINNCVGNNASNPGKPDTQLQIDFAYRSLHLMASVGKQLAQAFYGGQPTFSYWNGCSTGGRQGLSMAQNYPHDYNGILAGAPAVYFDRLGFGQIWPEVPHFLDTGGNISAAKQVLATNAAIAACDALDGVVDGVLTDPRKCTYNPALDPTITNASCAKTDNTCLSPAEAGAIETIWGGAVSPQGVQLWYGHERGAAISGNGGPSPNAIPVAQGQYWVYFDPTWDWHTLTYANMQAYLKKTMQEMEVPPITPTQNPDLSVYRDAGGKIIQWQGFADQLIPSKDSIAYYDSVNSFLGGGYAKTQQFYRHFMAPGVAHCGNGVGPQPQNLFPAVVNWVENGIAPATITATKASTITPGATQSRPLCPYPAFATYNGSGSTDDAANFTCM